MRGGLQTKTYAECISLVLVQFCVFQVKCLGHDRSVHPGAHIDLADSRTPPSNSAVNILTCDVPRRLLLIMPASHEHAQRTILRPTHIHRAQFLESDRVLVPTLAFCFEAHFSQIERDKPGQKIAVWFCGCQHTTAMQNSCTMVATPCAMKPTRSKRLCAVVHEVEVEVRYCEEEVVVLAAVAARAQPRAERTARNHELYKNYRTQRQATTTTTAGYATQQQRHARTERSDSAHYNNKQRKNYSTRGQQPTTELQQRAAADAHAGAWRNKQPH